MKKLLKLFSIIQAVRYGARSRGGYHGPGKKYWKKRSHTPYGHGPSAYGSPYGYPRKSRGIKGLLVEALVQRLLRR